MTSDRADKLVGCLLGTAVGDALGLPRERLSRRRAARLFGGPPLRHRFLLARGMMSDDTEHACLVGQALLASRGDPDRFAHALAWGLRGWLLGLPAGLGRATLLSTLKLWLGWPPDHSGIYSAGNGPAMRAPLLGAYFADDGGARGNDYPSLHPDHPVVQSLGRCCPKAGPLPSHRTRLCGRHAKTGLLEGPEQGDADHEGEGTSLLPSHLRASTRLTHTDPRAEQGALLVALAARHGAAGPVDAAGYLAEALPHVTDAGLRANVAAIGPHLERGATPQEFAAALGLTDGVTGFINHTVPVALFCWLRRSTDFRRAVEEVILLGGDADTTGAIVGGLMGATLGASAIPGEWVAGLPEWPRSVAWMRHLGEELAKPAGRPLPLFWPGLLPRNALFLLVVLLHAVRRMLPPY